MGSIFIYVTKDILPINWSIKDIEGKVLKQGSAYLLDKIVEKFPKEHRTKFPTLMTLEEDSGRYTDEKLFLLNEEVNKLKLEFDTILDILYKRQFLNNVDPDIILNFLCHTMFPVIPQTQILNELLEIKELIDFATSQDFKVYIDR